MIEVKGIEKSFGRVKAVDKVSFSISKGEVVGFIGPNAAGKSTTMRILTCYLPADAGEARVAGFDVFEDSMAVRARIGYLPENAPLYLDMRVDRFLDYVASIRGLRGPAKVKAISRIIELCGLKSVLMKQIGELSKGFRQRVGLAQAMIHDPEILILDEPTSGLDPLQIREIRGLIKELGREKTVILSTHILPEVETTCGRVIIIHNGRIISDSSLEALMKKGGQKNSHEVLVRGERAKIDSALKTLSDIISFQVLAEENGLLKYQLEVRERVHLGEQVSRLLADAGISVAELVRVRPSLESVFVDLIQQEEAKASADKEEPEDEDEEEDEEK